MFDRIVGFPPQSVPLQLQHRNPLANFAYIPHNYMYAVVKQPRLREKDTVMTKNEQFLDFLSTRASETDKVRRHILQRMVECVPMKQDALSQETAAGNVTLLCDLESSCDALQRNATALSIYSSMHRIFTQKMDRYSDKALEVTIIWLESVIVERTADLKPTIASIVGVQTYEKILRYAHQLRDRAPIAA